MKKLMSILRKNILRLRIILVWQIACLFRNLRLGLFLDASYCLRLARVQSLVHLFQPLQMKRFAKTEKDGSALHWDILSCGAVKAIPSFCGKRLSAPTQNSRRQITSAGGSFMLPPAPNCFLCRPKTAA
jgi:hypothetical protein